MMLKNSSWKTEKPHSGRTSPDMMTQMRENGKRRLWLFALLSFVLLLCYPVMTALTLSRYTTEGASLILKQGIGHNMLGISGGPTVLLLTVGGIMCVTEGFSWIYSRKKIDMYLSQPITAGRRFAMTYINGILIYFIPYIISLLLALLVISGAGAATGAVFLNVLFTLPVSLIYFLAVYNVTLIAMMISGKKSMAGFFILMGFLYDGILRTVLESYAATYFSTFMSRDREGMERYISPIFRMIDLLNENPFSWGMGEVTIEMVVEKLILPMLPGIFWLLLEGILFGVIAYYCYKKRPMEAASKAVAFPAVKGPVKVLLMLIAGLLGIACFRDMSGNDGFFVAFSGLLVGILFCQALLEIVYESDLRAFANHKKSFAFGAAAALFTYLFFALDISGYDTWVPKQEQIESAAIEINFDNFYSFDYVDENGEFTWDSRYGIGHMEMTDVSGVLSLARDGMGKGAREQNPDTRLSCNVKYKLKNGKEKYRNFFIDYEQEKTVLDILFANEEYKKGTNQILSAQMDAIFEKSWIYYNNGLQGTEIVDKNALTLMRAYQADIREMSFSDVMDAVPCGVLELRYKTAAMNEHRLEYPVFPSFTRTVEYLRGKNVELYLYINPAVVEKISLEYYLDKEDMEVIERENFYGSTVSSTIAANLIEKEYKNRAQIEELAGCLYPASLVRWCYTSDSFDQNIMVQIEGADRPEAYSYHWNNTEFMMKTAELPEFIKEDIGRK